MPITVTTLPVTDITTSSARLRGEIEVGGGEPPFWLDFEFVEREEGAPPYTYYAYLSNTVILPEDCTLYIHDNNERAGWIDWWWIKNDEMIRAGNSDFGTIENPYVSFNEGDSLAFDVDCLLAAMQGDTLDVELRLNSEDGVPVGYLYVEIRPSENCFLTTAMVNYYSKADNCPELMAMRTLRSHSGHKYPDVLDEYHRVSLQIIQGIEQSGQQEYYYGMIKDVVENTAALVANEEWQQAEHAYLNLYNWLKNEFQISKTIIEVIPAPLHHEIDGGKIFTLEGEELYSAYFQYRKKGASTWLETAKQTVTVDESQTFDAIVENLDDNTEYEYRAVTDYGGESYYGEILTFKTKLYTEYCEYNADTFRRIVVEQEYIADSLKQVIQTQHYNADTNRGITRAYNLLVDSIRQIVREQEYGADSLRTVLREDSYSADTKRATIKEYTFTADTLRKLLKSYEYQADMLRQVVKSYDYTADVLRRIAEEAEYQADALRKVLREDAYFADTVRQIIAEQEFIADAKRQIAKEFQFNADTLRHVIMPYKQLIITMSIQERQIDLSTQERQIDLSTQEREVKLGVEQMSLIGNTVRLKAEFKDFNGEHVSPENVNLRIYDGYKKQVGEDIPVLPSDVGKYQYDYVIPGDVIGPLYFEFVGTIGGLPVLGRATIDRRWI